MLFSKISDILTIMLALNKVKSSSTMSPLSVNIAMKDLSMRKHYIKKSETLGDDITKRTESCYHSVKRYYAH